MVKKSTVAFQLSLNTVANLYTIIKKGWVNKNHQEETNTADGRMYEIKGNFIYKL